MVQQDIKGQLNTNEPGIFSALDSPKSPKKKKERAYTEHGIEKRVMPDKMGK